LLINILLVVVAYMSRRQPHFDAYRHKKSADLTILWHRPTTAPNPLWKSALKAHTPIWIRTCS